MPEEGFNNHPELKPHRKQLRNNLTPAEARLWTCLKDKQLDGRKFRRQHSMGGYILDFYCPAERLAIELDGNPHFNPEAADYDRRRDAFMKQHGVLTLRFVNHRVFNYPEGVLDDIRQHFGWWKNDTTPSADAATPP
jgi:very-short-patch-repair endonuclease